MPVANRVAQEEEVAAAEHRRQPDRYTTRNVGAPEVVDVVVFCDDRAVAGVVACVHLATDLQDDRATLERELRRVRVRRIDDEEGPIWREVAELPPATAV